MDLRETGIDGANWIQLAEDMVQMRASVNTVMNLRVP
jgi:tRNA threonylcarbamoyladenosine modification (KEOPS) complex  Pcc1 subunit